MRTVTIREAQGQLADLIGQAARGEEIVITSPDAAVLLTPIVASARPRFGSARGLITISEDFDRPLADFASYER